MTNIYLFWGEDEFAMRQEIDKLRNEILDPDWSQFNFEKIPGERPDSAIAALNQAMTPSFGSGGRLVWLANTPLCQHSSEDLLAQLQRTLPALPETSTLLLTAAKKPDGRSKVTKLLQKHATIREFALIPPWKTEALVRKVENAAKDLGVRLTRGAVALLAESVGNDTRQLWNELEKLSLWSQKNSKPLDETIVSRLVAINTHNSLKLAEAIRQGKEALTLELVAELLARNEPPLRIVATLCSQFRLWAIVRLMIDAGERDEKAIAAAADIANPKRIYYLRQEIRALSSKKLLATLPILLQLEISLKRGSPPLETLQAQALRLCQACQ
ncbi:MAG: DNA polymerase III subunit delta [Cyanobacteriota bacterium]|nr:DNA polymerase III subunit delta [Cyanobacteriota bacterium]